MIEIKVLFPPISSLNGFMRDSANEAVVTVAIVRPLAAPLIQSFRARDPKLIGSSEDERERVKSPEELLESLPVDRGTVDIDIYSAAPLFCPKKLYLKSGLTLNLGYK